MDICVLMFKQEVNGKGVFYKALLDHGGETVICYLRSGLKRRELLKRLCTIRSLTDIYSIDEKAVMIEVG
ncbi:MAG: hypothetical protein H0Z33_04935 [Bacillaceae bacterium]|nr:hypothetical protein [Bacillaceae bacterium]